MEESNQNPQENPTPNEGEVISDDAKNMALLCHLLGLFTAFLGPLVIWLLKKESSKFVDEQGKEALNFQITVAIALFVSGLLTAICIGAFMLAIVWIADIVFCIMACMAVHNGEHYKYPVSIRLVK